MTQSNIQVWPTLYGKDSKGKIRRWDISTEGATITMTYGLIDGKQATKTITAEPKNVGRANATTAAEQAVVEAEAKVVKQKKSGYFEDIADAETYIPRNPMKAKDYKDHKNKVTYPCYVQPKLNGLRLLVDKNGNGWSKSGEPTELPAHWETARETAGALKGLDGEIYAGLGVLSLQDINAAHKKPNENTHKLKYYVYDLPHANKPAEKRMQELEMARSALTSPDVVFVETYLVKSEAEADALYKKWVWMGYEGMVYRSLTGEYEFEKRSEHLIKRKPRPTAEARVLSVLKDRVGQGVMTVEAVNGEQKGVQFDLLMLKSSVPGMNARLYEDACTLVGKTIEYAYEELSDSRIPTKPVGERLREVGDDGESRD